jgi:hypothetical protein
LGNCPESDPAKGLQPQPAIDKSLSCFALQIAIGPIGKFEPTRDTPFARLSWQMKNTLISFVKMNGSGKFH